MDRPFRFGVVGGSVSSRAEWLTLARSVEEFGYSTLLLPDRLMMPVAPFAALMAAAAATTTLRVGSYVFCNDYRHPAILAKEIATLDLLSEGRVEPGLGAGVGPSDFQQMGLPFESAGIRVSRLAESLSILKGLLSGETVNFAGKYYTINGLRGVPRPVQQPHPPIMVAGGHKRILSLAAQQADIIAIGGRPAAFGQDAGEPTLEQKIAWVQEAAGERFAQLELARTEFDITISDSNAEVLQLSNMPPLPSRAMSTEQAVDYLREQRERYGFSYIQVNQAQAANFAPVVALLNGK